MACRGWVIRGGLVFDGHGGPPIVEDLAFEGRTLVTRSSLSGPIPTGDAREIDASGMWVTPGLVDIHTHYDAELEAGPGLGESVRHGVTTVVIGNCSISLALGDPDDLLDLFTRVESMPRAVVRKWLEGRITWASAGDYYEHLEADVPMGPNVASFIGHSNIRIASMGLSRALQVKRPEDAELDDMERHLREAMEAGYLGMSLDMLPMHRMDGGEHAGTPLPSQRARPRERRRLARVLERHGGVLQGSPNAVPSSVLELLSLSASPFRRRPLKTTIVAALDVRRFPWGHYAVTGLTTIANVIFGADVRFQALADVFRVYSDGVTNPIMEEFPRAAAAITLPSDARKRMFDDPAFRKAFRREWRGLGGTFHRRFDEMEILEVPEHPGWRGQTFGDVARQQKRDALDLFMDLIAQYDDQIRWVTSVGNHRPAVRRRLLAHETTLPGFSDAGAHARNIGFQDAALQLLAEAQRDPDWMKPEEAVSRLTWKPARWLGLDVGEVAEGTRADLVIIDPEKLRTGLSADPIEERPKLMLGDMRLVRRSDGVVRHVFIGGRQAFSADAGFDPALGVEPFGTLLRRL